ncbi:MAG: hypothetical protein FJ000_01045 [Actinobacteria bacterium]|nr:hypothetical protein [Actinomycetota bacterium]
MRVVLLRHRRGLVATFLMIALLLIVGACGGEEPAPEPESPTPEPAAQMEEANAALGQKVMMMASQAAQALSGEYGDLHVAVVAAGDRDNPEYEQIHEALARIKEETGATYVYTLIEVSDEMTNLIVDASVGEDADDYGAEYAMEPQMAAAFAGEPAYAEHTWTDESYGVQKSAFAPLLDSDGEIVAILGIDYPAPALEQYPELLAD